jgi:hypothetical protein
MPVPGSDQGPSVGPTVRLLVSQESSARGGMGVEMVWVVTRAPHEEQNTALSRIVAPQDGHCMTRVLRLRFPQHRVVAV